MLMSLTVMAVDFGTGGVLATSKGLLCVHICTVAFSQKNAIIEKLLHTYHCSILHCLHDLFCTG